MGVKTRAVQGSTSYWDRIVHGWNERRTDALWRAFSDSVNSRLLARWLPSGPLDRILKTDLFDEAVSEGVYPLLRRHARSVVAIDISPRVVDAACARYPLLGAVSADVSVLPFRDNEFDAIISISTLDHFDSNEKIDTAVGQLYRVLAPGGSLIVTLDNGSNPVVALRNRLPQRLLQTLRVIPYRMGVTYAASRFLESLRSHSFEVRQVSYTIHCPRLAAVVASRVIQRVGSAAISAWFLQRLSRLERLERFVSRAVTGHYVAVLAKKR